MSKQLPLNSFITQATNKQLQKRTGGIPTVWTEDELNEMRSIANEVKLGNFSRSQALEIYKEARKAGNILGNIRPNKSPTAFKNKLSEVIRESETKELNPEMKS